MRLYKGSKTRNKFLEEIYELLLTCAYAEEDIRLVENVCKIVKFLRYYYGVEK